MKRMKKIVSLLLAAVMVLAMTITASADPAAKTPDLSKHTYDAYQIFSGTQTDAADDATLASVEWGSGINSDAFLADLKADTTIGSNFADCSTAADVAAKLGKLGWQDDSTQARKFAKLAEKNKSATVAAENVTAETVLYPGYYLIVDTTATDGQTDAVKNLALLQLTKKGTFEIKNKTDIPEVEKKVDDKNDSNTEENGESWQDSADYDIGDNVPFKLTGTLPSNLDDYSAYEYIFHDTLCNGLTYNGDIKVYLNTVAADKEITNSFTITPSTAKTEGGGELTISTANIKAITGVNKDSKIIVTYTARLNENANIGKGGNDNRVYLEYSNNPNSDGTGKKGRTPEDIVIVFTYKTVVDKINGKDKSALDGAAFTLYKKFTTAPEGKTEIDTTKYPTYAGYYAVGTTEAGNNITQFEFKGIDDGNYVLVETTVPNGFNPIAPIEFTVTAEHDITSDNPALKNLTATSPFTANLNDGKVEKADKSEKDVVSGEIYTEVENNQGATLPETGGIGTTIFYVLGTILVLGAAILLITKKRMSAEK